MRKIVESLKRLYETGRITREQLSERVEKGTITLAEYNSITGLDDELSNE